MILYVDTSALLKLYVREDESAQTLALIQSATAVYVHLIAYAELRAGLAKACRLGRVNDSQLRSLVEDADRDWARLRHISVDAHLVMAAGALAEQHGLRGFDSLHLAAASRLSRRVGDAARLRFFAFDQGLNAAAAKVGMGLVQLD